VGGRYRGGNVRDVRPNYDGHCTKAYILILLHEESPAVHSVFPETLPLERFEAISRFMHFADNSKQHEYQGPPQLFKIMRH
jgi:hypothetical protein